MRASRVAVWRWLPVRVLLPLLLSLAPPVHAQHADHALREGGALSETRVACPVNLLPHDRSRPVTRLRKGTPVVIVGQREVWAEVVTETGKRGWVKQEHLAVLRAAGAGGAPGAPPSRPAEAVDAAAPTTQSAVAARWHYLAPGGRQGPVSDEDLCVLLGRRDITAQTRVAMRGYKSWVPLHRIEDLVARCTQQSGADDTGWFVSDAGKRKGPLATVAICVALFSRTVGRDAKVARKGDSRWTPIAEVEAIRTMCGIGAKQYFDADEPTTPPADAAPPSAAAAANTTDDVDVNTQGVRMTRTTVSQSGNVREKRELSVSAGKNGLALGVSGEKREKLIEQRVFPIGLEFNAFIGGVSDNIGGGGTIGLPMMLGKFPATNQGGFSIGLSLAPAIGGQGYKGGGCGTFAMPIELFLWYFWAEDDEHEMDGFGVRLGASMTLQFGSDIEARPSFGPSFHLDFPDINPGNSKITKWSGLVMVIPLGDAVLWMAGVSYSAM